MHRAIANYAQGQSDEDGAVLQRYGPLIDRCARRLVMRTGLHSAYDDLWSAGALGLLEATRRFDSTRGVAFETFAEHRIRGSMLDELRKLDHLPRRLRSRTDDLVKAKRKLASQLGREATTEEVAAELRIGLDEASDMEALLEPHLPLESALPYLVSEESAEDPAQRAQVLKALKEALSGISERLQTVLSLHYVEDLTYREIARLLGVSEPRICQLHAEALSKLRDRMKL